ncbi:MAG: 4Fe-4S binding protein, partial [Devosiaceae bacterium]|nr:4Fe-4S binding protein [Devosiaceae bacterium]
MSSLLLFAFPVSAQTNSPEILRFIQQVTASDLVEGATSYGPLDTSAPVVPVLNGEELLGYAFITSDFVGTTGYSGKPIHVMVAIDLEGKLLRAELVKHSEPIVLIGIPDAKIKALTASYSGLDIVAEVAAGGEGHDLNIISGATVTIMIIDDSIVRSSIKVARIFGLGGLSSQIANSGPTYELDMQNANIADWMTLSGDGSVRRLTLDVGQINTAFAETGDEKAMARPDPGPDDDTYIDMQVALVSLPAIGLSLLGEAEFSNLQEWLEEGEQAILVMGRGRYSFKGSGYVRGGVFDRIQLIQGDTSVRFRDKQHRRLGGLAIEGAPTFTELDLFKIPADAGVDPTQPWRLQLLVQRSVGAIEKRFITFNLGYKVPPQFLLPLASDSAPVLVDSISDDSAARTALWQRIWRDKKIEIGILVVMLTILTGVFFFQVQATRHARAFYWFRMGFLVVTLVFLGWSQNAQLSIVNLMALGASINSGFTWDTFLLDPLVFILWVSVAVTLLFWGRGGYCGWLCPFGALQELTNQIARFFKVPQWRLPWGLHERLWPIKYMIFLGLVGLSLI